jgi:hypothetical protein
MSPYLKLSPEYLDSSTTENGEPLKQGLYRVTESYYFSKNNKDFRKFEKPSYRFYVFQRDYVVISGIAYNKNPTIELKDALEKLIISAGKYNVKNNEIELTVFGALDFETWNGFYTGEILSDTTIQIYQRTTDSWNHIFYYKDHVLELVDSTYRVPNIERIDEWKVKKRKK